MGLLSSLRSHVGIHAFFAILLTASNASGANPEGVIPLDTRKTPVSTDLYYQGRILTPPEAVALRNQGQDLSQVNPDPNTNIWQDRIGGEIPVSEREIELAKTTEAEFLSTAAAPSEVFKFVVRAKDSQNRPVALALSLDPLIRNILLRKALLSKIGYEIAPSAVVDQIKIRFPSEIDKKAFLTDLELKLFRDVQSRWIVGETPTTLTLQDVLVTEDKDDIYDLAKGNLYSSTIQNRRLLSALLVPFSLTYVPESVNLFEWQGALVVNEGLSLQYPNRAEYGPSIDDVRWIARRIAALGQEDWEKITQYARLPEAVRLLVLQKLYSRRSTLLEKIGIEGEFLELDQKRQFPKPDYKISLAPDLAKGEVTRERWPGYSTRFSFGDPESPLSPGELGRFGLSRLISIALENAVGVLNDLPYFKTDIDEKIEDRRATEFLSQLEEFERTGKVSENRVKTWAIPFVSGSLVLSRDVVTGSYLGTDNLLQLADSIGVVVNAGAKLIVNGVAQPFGVGGSADAGVSRVYTHVRPLTSFKAANRYPFKNLFVPLMTRKLGKTLDQVLAPGFGKKDEAERETELRSVISSLGEMISIGESFIITDSVVANASFVAQAKLYQVVEIDAAPALTKLFMRRLHLFRRDANTFQVYVDRGNALQPSFTLAVGIDTPLDAANAPGIAGENPIKSARLPILTLKTQGNRGKARTSFYTIPFGGPDTDEDENLEAAAILKSLLKNGSTEFLKSKLKPIVIENEFKERLRTSKFLMFSSRKLRSSMDLTIRHPLGAERRFVRDSMAITQGRDIENLSADVLGFLAERAAYRSVSLGNSDTINPGYTVFGRAKNKILEFETELNPNGEWVDPFVKVSQVYNGWKISQKKALKIIEDIEAQVGKKIFPRAALENTDSVFLYNIGLYFHLYPPAIERLRTLSEEQIRTYFVPSDPEFGAEYAREVSIRLRRFREKRDTQELLKVISIADKWLTPQAFFDFLGGANNLFVYASMNGFRKGDEAGDRPIDTDTIGVVGSPRSFGPLSAIRRTLNITEGEFLSSWITKRAF